MAVLSFCVYYYFEFYPRCNQARDILRKTNQLYKEPPKALIKLVILSEGRNNLAPFVARKLLNEFGYSKPGMLVWHTRSMLWTILLYFHFNESERFAFWCHFARYEEGQGLNNSAQYHYGRNLDQLSDMELATLIVIARNPSLYKTNPIKLNERVTELLKKYSIQ
jgi:hypothetical protein